ncbi:MAG TPA: hypothetical protein VIF15_20350 [Polyangiaceae bacterium]
MAVALVLAALCVAAAAQADPTSADRETARALMQEGRDLRDKGDLKGALKRFKGADDIMHVPTTALEVAKAEVALGMFVEARDAVAAIRQTPAKSNEPAPFKEARAKADELDASLNGRIPALMITVKGSAPGQAVTVSIDDNQVPAGVLGLARSVDPGHHVVTAKTAAAEGKQEVDVREGEQKPVEITLVATATPPPETVEPPPGADAETPPPTTRSHSPNALTYVGIVVAGAGVIAGSITGYLSMSQKSTVQNECGNGVCGPSSYSDLDSANMFATVSDVAFAVAGAGAVVAIVSLVVGHEDSGAPTAQPPPSTARRVSPWLGLGAAGLIGTF